jgi:hypothetical protein
MTDKQRLFEAAVRDAVVVLTIMKQETFEIGPAFATADASTDKAKAAGWTFAEIEAEAERRVSA